ncbi:MAG: hypothetical protein ABIP38_05490 [Steroidobacteraceae bacterium]
MRSVLQRQANRRQLLVGGACTVATALAAGAALAGEEGAALTASASLVLHDPGLPLEAGLQQRLRANGARLMPLTGDPVRLWRDQLSALLAPRDARLLGVTRWPDFLMIRGLAAESRRHVRYQRMDARTGVIVWLIA